MANSDSIIKLLPPFLLSAIKRDSSTEPISQKINKIIVDFNRQPNKFIPDVDENKFYHARSQISNYLNAIRESKKDTIPIPHKKPIFHKEKPKLPQVITRIKPVIAHKKFKKQPVSSNAIWCARCNKYHDKTLHNKKSTAPVNIPNKTISHPNKSTKDKPNHTQNAEKHTPKVQRFDDESSENDSFIVEDEEECEEVKEFMNIMKRRKRLYQDNDGEAEEANLNDIRNEEIRTYKIAKIEDEMAKKYSKDC